MKKLKPKPKRKLKRRRRPQDFVADDSASGSTTRKKKNAQKAAGPVMEHDSEPQAELADEHAESQPEKYEDDATAKVGPAPSVEGTGPEHHEEAHTNGGGSLRLEGRTDADFSSSFRTTGERVRSATTCEACSEEDQCVHATGSLISNYRVRTTVTLPSVGDFPNLTPCQQQRVRTAINTVLAPHERQHVRAFETYNGVTRRRFDLTLCRSEFDSIIRDMFNAEEGVRQAAAQAASDVLDPFNFDVDLDCEDEQKSAGPGIGSQPFGSGIVDGDEGQ